MMIVQPPRPCICICIWFLGIPSVESVSILVHCSHAGIPQPTTTMTNATIICMEALRIMLQVNVAMTHTSGAVSDSLQQTLIRWHCNHCMHLLIICILHHSL